MPMELWKRAPRLDETSIFGFLKIFEIQAGVAQTGPKGGGSWTFLGRKSGGFAREVCGKSFRGKFYDPPFGTPFSGPFWERFLRVSLAPDIDHFGSDKHIDLKSHLGAILGSILKLSL